VTAALFGADRITAYTLDWETTDANLLAIEQQDFFEAVGTGRTPEVTGRDGLRAVAIINAWLESSYAGREVAVSEVLDGTVHAYQDTLGGGEQP
jgi:predicted dehydrogenase